MRGAGSVASRVDGSAVARCPIDGRYACPGVISRFQEVRCNIQSRVGADVRYLLFLSDKKLLGAPGLTNY